MKNIGALGVGVAMVVTALYLALGSTSQALAPQSEVARAFATALHTTPTLTSTPARTPTPMHVRKRVPDAQAILALLFQDPYRGAFIGTSHALVFMRLFNVDGGGPALMVAGQDAEATDGIRTFPAAFGAILVWENSEYIVKFRQVEFGITDARIEYAALDSGMITFRFSNLGPAGSDDANLQRTVILHPCDVRLGMAPLRWLEWHPDGNRAWQCF